MRVLVTLFSLSLLACPPKKPVVEQPGDAPATTTAGDPARAATPSTRAPVTGCPGEPAWMAWAPCQSADAVWVVGKAPGANPLARSTASNRGRAELIRLGFGEELDDGRVTLQGTEAFDSFVCKEETYGLVRVAVEEPPAVELTSCEGIAFEPEEDPEATCPVWTRRGAWRVGENVVAVGAVSGLKNRSLASKTARNRAMVEAQKVTGIALKIAGETISSSVASSPPGIPTDPEIAECDGTLYTRVTYTRP